VFLPFSFIESQAQYLDTPFVENENFIRDFVIMSGLPEDCFEISPPRCELFEYFRRWETDISISVYGLGDRVDEIPIVEDIIEEFSNEFNDRTGLQMQLSQRNIDIIVYLLDSEVFLLLETGVLPAPEYGFLTLRRHLETDGACGANTLLSDSSTIVAAFLYIGQFDQERELSQCVREELFNSIGMSNDPLGLPSLFDHPYFSALSKYQVLPEYFLQMISLLYGLDSLSIDEFVAVNDFR